MRLGFVILSHRDWRQVAHLVEVLHGLDPSALIAISHDSRDNEGAHYLAHLDDVMLQLRAGTRGEFTLVDRWLQIVAALGRHEANPDFIILLSGQDYPLVNPEQIKRELAGSGDGYMEYFDVLDPHACPWPHGAGHDRYFYRWRRLATLDEATGQRLRALHAVNRLQPWLRVNVMYNALRVGVRDAGPPLPYKVYGGSQWHAISWRAVERVMASLQSAPELLTWARRSLVSDEAFFQTLLINDPDLAFQRGSRRYYRFDGDHTGHPATLDATDAETVLTSGAWFARKLDWVRSRALMGIIDARIASTSCPDGADPHPAGS